MSIYHRLGSILAVATAFSILTFRAPLAMAVAPAMTQLAGSPFVAGAFPGSIAVADFNGDGKPDLVVGAAGNDFLRVYLGNGSGGFTEAPGSPYSVVGGSYWVIARDFNGDGKIDIAASTFWGSLTVYRGDGAGRFTLNAGSPMNTFSEIGGMAAGDFNGDGKQDLVMLFPMVNYVGVLIGSGSGTFTVTAYYRVGATPSAVAVGDFNGDGKLDLAVTNYGDNTVSILLGNGAGGFSAAAGSPVAVGTTPTAVVASDLNSNTKLDLVVANYGSGNVSVLIGDGSGRFSAAPGSPFAVGANPAAVAVGDFTSNGRPEIAAANFGAGQVALLQANGAGGYVAVNGSPLTVGSGPFALVAADLNADGISDLAVANWNSNNVSILLGTVAPGRIPTAAFRDTSSIIRTSIYGSSSLYSGGSAWALDPVVSQNSVGDTVVVTRDSGSALWAATFRIGTATWTSWSSGGGLTTGVPGVAVASSGIAWVAVRDRYNYYWLTSYTPGVGFDTWLSFTGLFSQDPVLAACPDGSLYLVGVDTGRSVAVGRFMPPSTFQGWQWGAGVVKGNVSAVCGSDNIAYVVMRDDSNVLWLGRSTASTFLGWSYGAGTLGADPKIVANGAGVVYPVIRDSSGTIYYRAFAEGTSSSWGSWVSTSGVMQDFSPAFSGGSLYIAGRSAIGEAWWYKSGIGWTLLGYRGFLSAPSAAPH